MSEAINDGIKWIMIVGAVGCFAAFFALFVVFAFSGRVKDREDLGGNVFVLGELPVQKNKKKPIFVDRMIYHIFGVTMKSSEYEGRISAIAQTLGRMLENEEKKQGTIALVGDAEGVELRAIEEHLTKSMPEGMKTVVVGNILTDAEANRTAYSSDGVVLAVQDDVTLKKAYRQMRDQLEACSVKVWGVILAGCQAI